MDRITQIDQLRSHLVLDDMANLDETFACIADALLNNFVIAKGKLKSYRILEIEFYHNLAETTGKDKTITYERSASAGQWFFHSSGVDICSDVRWHPRKEWPKDDDEKKYRFYLPEDCWGYDKSQKYPAYSFEKK